MMQAEVYNPYDLTVEKAEGIRIYTDKGVYLDTFAGIGVMNLGHSDPDVVNAIISRVRKYSHLSNYFLDPQVPVMAEKLLNLTGRKGCVYFSNSGTESTEAALKAIKKCRKKGKIVSFEGNFHGRTTGALSITHSRKIREPFEPLLADTVFLPLDGSALRKFASENEIAGLFVECIQGNSGVLPIPEELAETIMDLRKEKDFLLVADEIQAGLGRTGQYFSYQGYGLEPDIVTIGKSIGGGLPLGATLFLDLIPFEKGDHGSTFAPNPVAVSAGMVFLSRLTPDFLKEVREKGQYFAEGLSRLKWVTEVRQKGLMIGAGTSDPETVKRKAFDNKVLLNVTGGGIRFLPPLNITTSEIDEILEKIDL
jgi:acetylornithine/succinyldiaminopimelate/putrescine aminotransferase